MKEKPARLPKQKPKNKWFIPVTSGVMLLILLVAALLIKRPVPVQAPSGNPEQTSPVTLPSENISLPNPDYRSGTSVEAALKQRRTKRAFLDQSLTTKQVSQMLWAAQGVTSDWGGRTTPSAKSVYPLSLYLIVNKVDGLEPGQYLYVPGDRAMVHQLKPIKKASLGEAIFNSLNQNAFKDIPAIAIITGNMTKMAQAFGNTPQDKNVYLEAGHAAQNMYLQAESLKIGLVTNTSFQDNIIRNIITIPEEETLIYMVPFGHPKE